METALLWGVTILFSISTLALATYGCHLYVLLYLFRRRVQSVRRRQSETIAAYWKERDERSCPVVTTQLPIYNERDVAQRVIEAAAAMEYPAGRHEIHVLDDSDDSTRDLVDDVAAGLRKKGANIRVIRRPDRSGYKAGALAHGLKEARGAYMAVFDSDFVPPVDFLKKAIPLIEASSDLACLQGRWAHLNRDESWLTEAQALGIDGHFAIEQGARAWNGLMMNFNGTGGIWRRAAIEDPRVGGWSADTLTEDLDLSYRAQLAGWRIGYCLDLTCPAELPGTVAALKSQQRRWATGSIQVSRKLLPQILRANRSFAEKVEAVLHLTHYSVALWMLLLALVARPMLLVFTDGHLFHHWFWIAWTIIILSAVAPSLTYAYARHALEGRWSAFRTVPSMLVLGCGMCVNNSLAVIRGLFVRGGEFVRTPKSGSAGRAAKRSSYQSVNTHMWAVELSLGVYSLFSFIVYFNAYHRAFSFFLLLYAIGFLLIGWLSIPRQTALRTLTRAFRCLRLRGADVPS